MESTQQQNLCKVNIHLDVDYHTFAPQSIFLDFLFNQIMWKLKFYILYKLTLRKTIMKSEFRNLKYFEASINWDSVFPSFSRETFDIALVVFSLV